MLHPTPLFASRRAVDQQRPEGQLGTSTAEVVDRPDGAEDTPEVILWAALSLAPDEGTTVPDLMATTGMSRPWIYFRLRELAEQGHVIQVSRGRWRAVLDDAS